MISLNNAEKVFDGLDRLGKPARLVRYWGEAHNFQSPANIRDVWRRTREWFDRYIRPPAAPLTGAALALHSEK
jgi:dipeptidyl aminopeptidase/acylaminoacyl peptidase